MRRVEPSLRGDATKSESPVAASKPTADTKSKPYSASEAWQKAIALPVIVIGLWAGAGLLAANGQIQDKQTLIPSAWMYCLLGFYFLYGIYCVIRCYTSAEWYWQEIMQRHRLLIIASFFGIFLFQLLPIIAGWYLIHIARPRLLAEAKTDYETATNVYTEGDPAQVVDKVDTILNETPELMQNPWIAANWIARTDAQKQAWIAERRDLVRDVIMKSIKAGDRDGIVALLMEIDKQYARRAAAQPVTSASAQPL